MAASFRFACLAVAALAFAPLGCSFSESSATSSKSVSDSISSPFTSSSKSSKSDSQEYEDDVAAYTKGFVRGGGSAAGLRDGLGDIAKKHGVSDWEADKNTYEGVGVGLARAGLQGIEYQGYRDAVAAGDAERAAAIDRGYKSAD